MFYFYSAVQNQTFELKVPVVKPFQKAGAASVLKRNTVTLPYLKSEVNKLSAKQW